MGRRKTPEEVAWLEERYPTTGNAELSNEFETKFGWRIEPGNLAAWASARGLRKATETVDWRGHPEYDEFLRGFIPGHDEREISEAFETRFGIRLTRSRVKNAKMRLGISSGTHGGRFMPGNEPVNKGRTWDEMGMSEEARIRCRGTQFKRGNIPHNARNLPVGSERVSRDGYVEVKVREHSPVPCTNKCWVPKHRLVWEAANGRSIGKDEVVLFADGDTRNFDPRNLVAVTHAENIGLQRIGRPYADRETLLDALKVVRLNAAISSAEMRTRRCRRCGREFSPRFARQRTCDACLGSE